MGQLRASGNVSDTINITLTDADSYGDGGDGGKATAISGQGGNGGPTFPDGATGGNMLAVGVRVGMSGLRASPLSPAAGRARPWARGTRPRHAGASPREDDRRSSG